MSRQARVVIPNVPVHVTQRGNRKENIFLDDEDMSDSLYFEQLKSRQKLFNF